MITAESQAAQHLLAALRETLADNDDMVATVIEGETDLREALQAGLDRLDEIHTMRDALDDRMGQMQKRAERLGTQRDRLRAAMREAMDRTGIKSLELPTGTLSIRSTPRAVQIIDADMILPQYKKQVAPVPDKTAIGAALRSGLVIAGAQLSNAATTLSISSR
jgi:hypothetical protein